MEPSQIKSILDAGQTAEVAFLSFSGELGPEIFQTICAFLNRFGGEAYLGVEADGRIRGVPAGEASRIIRALSQALADPRTINPVPPLTPLKILEVENKKIIRIRVPLSSDTHRLHNIIYDREGLVNVQVTSATGIAQTHIRKQNFFAEKTVLPEVRDADLRLDRLQAIRQMARARYGAHPWAGMTDRQLLLSAGLIDRDWALDKMGYNLAAVALLGRDRVISSLAPACQTQVLRRAGHLNSPFGRMTISASLLDSYGILMGLARKYLREKFHGAGKGRLSLRSLIAHELLVNCLIHRDLRNPRPAKFILENDRAMTENGSFPRLVGAITAESVEPIPKNPLIASFFRDIGLAEGLGSGLKKLFYYGRLYSDREPILLEEEVFRAIIPLENASGWAKESHEDSDPTKIQLPARW
ncbi:MAG: putative DNA binding domain-containing protein [Deltaproteobacteria bacterium]|jgi:ATP-dependent DNA helicase RecG|nr:putative DNA binding domain-containing protein [Deltaproteobacteria bacterium]